MNYQKQYANRINWKNSPDTSTPLNATNLNKMDNALNYIDEKLFEAIGGGIVEANPSGSTTSNLNKIGINGIVYGISGGGGGGDVYACLGIGKKTGVTSNVIDTDIELHRAPIVGDRLLVYFDEKVTNPTGLNTYNNGTAVTSNLENVTPLYINAGWNILEFKNDGLLYNNVWVRKQNVPIPNNTLSGLSDTAILSPSDGQMLAFDNSLSKWKNKTIAPNSSGTPVRELKTLQIGDNVFDTFGLKTFDVSSVTSGVNGSISVDVITASQLDGEIIAVHTGSNSGTTGNAWTLALSDGQTIEALTMSKGGSAYTDAITADCLLFVKCDISNSTATLLGIAGAGSDVSANGSGTPASYLNKLKIGSAIYDTSAIRPFSVSQIANNAVKIYVADIDQLDGNVIALSTGALTGTTSSAWSLNLVDTSGGAVSLDVDMLNADGTAFTDDISANELLFVAIDLTNYEGTILSVVGKSEDEIKTATGNPVTLTDAVAGNAIDVSAEIVASQSGSGTPSPTNIRPISGFSSVTITREDAQGQTATVTVALGSTVYGGTLDLTSGELTVTHAIVDMGDLSWTYYQPNEVFLTDSITDKKKELRNLISSCYKISSGSGAPSMENGDILGSSTTVRVLVKNTAYNDATVFQTAMTGQKILYELATPTTTTLTAAQLALVKGQNTLTCNSGDMSITYKASGLDALKERVDELEDAVEDIETDLASKTENSVVGTVESGTTASQAYAVGEHFIRNDKFCTAIAAIASGATLTLNTNYVEGTIAEALTRAETYSTTETKVGTWLGHDLYRKVIDCGALPNNAEKYTSSGISGSITLKSINGIARQTSTNSALPLPYVSDTSNYSLIMTWQGNGDAGHPNYVRFYTNANLSGYDSSQVVIEYIKNS